MLFPSPCQVSQPEQRTGRDIRLYKRSVCHRPADAFPSLRSGMIKQFVKIARADEIVIVAGHEIKAVYRHCRAQIQNKFTALRLGSEVGQWISIGRIPA